MRKRHTGYILFINPDEGTATGYRKVRRSEFDREPAFCIHADRLKRPRDAPTPANDTPHSPLHTDTSNTDTSASAISNEVADSPSDFDDQFPGWQDMIDDTH
jgi:hypothetical protein